MDIPFIILTIVCAYVIGSFPSAYIAGRIWKGIDIRQTGSRNMGAMNVFYKVGFRQGLLVLALDIGKGAAAVALAKFLGVPEIGLILAGIAAVLGHVFSIFLKFRGGTGGATSIGVCVFLMPWSIPFILVVFIICLLLTRYPTLSYSVAFICFPFVGWLIYHKWELAVLSLGLLMLILVRYIPRIREMRTKAGGWRHVFLRKGIKDRL